MNSSRPASGKKAKTSVPRHLSDAEIDTLAFRLLELLDGITVGQALEVLTQRAPFLLYRGHAVQVKSPGFRAMRAKKSKERTVVLFRNP
jgi:hypothetical protein